MALMFLLLSQSRVHGLMSLEKDIEDPQNSDIFSAYPPPDERPDARQFYPRLLPSDDWRRA